MIDDAVFRRQQAVCTGLRKAIRMRESAVEQIRRDGCGELKHFPDTCRNKQLKGDMK
jgi:hypothetical protein